MKILQINNFHYLKGGSEKVYLETSDLLVSNGHAVQFFSTKNSNNEPTEYEKYFLDEIDFFKIKNFILKIQGVFRFVFSHKAARSLNRLIKKQKPDIAHLHVFQGRLSCSILPVLKKHKIPIVFSLHEYKVLCPVYTFLDNKNELCEACQGKHFYNCLLKKCNQNNISYSFVSMVESYLRDTLYPVEKYGDHFIMVSDFVYNKHLQYRPDLKSKSTRLYNFLNHEHYPQNKVIKGDYFLFFGRIVQEKGIMTLLKAFLKKNKLQLKIVGSGPEEAEVKNFIRANEMSNVELIGYKKGAELSYLIRNASFTVVPSEWYESFGLIIIESMALGTPVIAANIGAIPELVKENYNGFLFTSKNCDQLIEKLETAHAVTDIEYQLLSENSSKSVKDKFTKGDYYNKLITIYQNTISAYKR